VQAWEPLSIDRGHALQHLHELRAHIAFLRPMQAGSPAYKLWLGDLVEFVQALWGPGSPQLAQIADQLRGGSVESGSLTYLRRLQGLDRLLEEYERGISAG
jgi:hypothetical protein